MILSLKTKDELSRLIKDYYAGVPVNVLVNRYGLNVPSNRLINHLPPIVAKNKCKRCNVNFLAKRPARGSKVDLVFSCPVCNQQLDNSAAVTLESNSIIAEFPEFKLAFFATIALRAYGSGSSCIHFTPLKEISSDYLMSIESAIRTKLSAAKIIDENWDKLSNEGRPVPINLSPDVIVALKNLQWLDINDANMREDIVSAWKAWVLVDCLEYFYRTIKNNYPLSDGIGTVCKEDMTKLRNRLNLISPIELKKSMYRGVMITQGVNNKSPLSPNVFLSLATKKTLEHEPKKSENEYKTREVSTGIKIISEVSGVSENDLFVINGMILAHQLEAKVMH